ncbi:snaclec 5-like isoform X2 [Saccostrea cucullata]|uniref:snaclec 5-like isoform X2 n=1 Tax=Saccostrea cuccullata TaxID=36930 RepID=UPI002ED11906
MRSLVICILSWFVLLAISKGISVRALQSKDDVLMKKISDLQFQLFTSIQEREKIIKTAVFETQCSVSGCAFDVCDKRKSVCSSGWKRYNKHCYRLFSTKMNWFQAQMFCRKQGTTLLQINDARESMWLLKNFPKVRYWIDLTDIGKERTWMSLSTGKGPTFTNWAKGQPDYGKLKQHCAYCANWSGRGEWDNGECDYKTQVICELSGSGF